jgi:hypothetical protein
MKAINEVNSFNQQSIFQSVGINTSSKYIKKEILFSHKSTLEKTLSLIKDFQINCLLNTETDKKKFSNLKPIILLFKKHLITSLNDKLILLQQTRDKTEKKKEDLQNKIFSLKNDSSSEIEQLKLLNFEIENKIQNTDYEIERTIKAISSIKSIKEIFVNLNNKNMSKVSDLLGDNLNLIKTYEEHTISIKDETKKQIKIISKTISDYKNMIKTDKKDKDYNSNKNNFKEESNSLFKTTISLNKNNEGDNQNNYQNKDCILESFHSSLYTDSFTLNQEEDDCCINKINQNNDDILNLSNDNINTENSNNNSDKTLSYNKTIEKRNLCENYIFANLSGDE